MPNERDIFTALQDAIRVALCEAANEEIKKARDRFECNMGQIKREMVGKIVNQLQITASHNLPDGEYVIQLRLNGGKNG